MFYLLDNLFYSELSGDQEVFRIVRSVFDSFLVIFIVTFIVFLTSTVIVISFKEYKYYFKSRNFPVRSNQFLTFEDIFENEIRRRIINNILSEPGIHHNELQRRCNLQKGQLQWHLQVLLRYKIIKKKKVGQFSLFYPNFRSQTFDDFAIETITKSKTTLKILDIIENNPGIISSKIAEQLDLSRSSVKYHVDKLLNKKLILSEKSGREIELYPRLKN
jgi:predicted transcriptional regulator